MAQSNDPRLMSDADYKIFLAQVEAALPKWETDLRAITPETDSAIPYSMGKLIVGHRDEGLTTVDGIRRFVARLQAKRTVYGELSLEIFLKQLYDLMNEIETLENASGAAPNIFEKNAPELGALYARIQNDALVRVALLEKGTCP
jgi:hypothetical protein